MNRRMVCVNRLTTFRMHWLRFPRQAAGRDDCGSEREVCLMRTMAASSDPTPGSEQLPC